MLPTTEASVPLSYIIIVVGKVAPSSGERARYWCWAGNGPSGGRTPLSWQPREFRVGTNQSPVNIAGKPKVLSYHQKRRPVSLVAYVSNPHSRRPGLCAEAIKTIPCSPALALVPLLPHRPPLHCHLRPFLGTGIVVRHVLRTNNALCQREDFGRCPPA